MVLDLKKLSRIGGLLLLAAGILVRVVVYIQNRSAFLDEANLMRNIAELDYMALFGALKYEQFAPPLFSLIQKTHWDLLGPVEESLRWFPLQLAIAAFFLFWHLCQRWIQSDYIRWIPVFIFAFHPELIRYATECKQYGADVFIAIFLPFLALESHGKFGWKQAVLWAGIGCFSILFSMPSVFVLAGIGFYFLQQHWRQPAMLKILCSIGIWVVCFALYYYLNLSRDAGSDYLQSYHDQYFLPILPNRQTWEILRSLLSSVSGYTTVALIVGSLYILGGMVSPKRQFFFLIAPILFCFLASMLRQYSLIERLALFMIPLLILLFGLGIDWFAKKIPPLLLILLAIPGLSLMKGYEYFWDPLEVSNVRDLLDRVSHSFETGDTFYCGPHTLATIHFYRDHHRDREYFRKAPVPEELSWEDIPVGSQQEAGSRKVFVLYGHLSDLRLYENIEQHRKEMATIGKETCLYREKGAMLVCWEIP